MNILGGIRLRYFELLVPNGDAFVPWKITLSGSVKSAYFNKILFKSADFLSFLIISSSLDRKKALIRSSSVLSVFKTDKRTVDCGANRTISCLMNFLDVLSI